MAEREQGLSLTVRKAMGILDCLGASDRSLSAGEIGRRLGLARSTVYRLLATLATGDFVSRDPSDARRYRLGFKITELASSLLDSIELRQQALPFLTELRDIAQETVHLVVMDQGQVAYIDKVECSKAVRMHSAVGRRGYVHCTAVGKAMLSCMSERAVERILAQQGLPACTPNTITDRQTLLLELEKVRRQGYAVDDIENEEGIRCLGAPVFDHLGRPAAALSVSGPAYRLSMERVRELADVVMSTASRISRQLGYSG